MFLCNYPLVSLHVAKYTLSKPSRRPFSYLKFCTDFVVSLVDGVRVLRRWWSSIMMSFTWTGVVWARGEHTATRLHNKNDSPLT